MDITGTIYSSTRRICIFAKLHFH